MSILTNRELDFLAGLNTSWRRLYGRELALLLNADGADRPAERFRVLNGHDTEAGDRVTRSQIAAGGENLSARSGIRLCSA